MITSFRRRLQLLTIAASLAILLAACDEEDGERFEWSATITSADSTLHTINSDDENVYGWNLLVGETEIDGEVVDVQMQGNVDYAGGSGPFFGFVTLTLPGGDVLALRMDGEADADADTSDAGLTADLEVIGGTGRYLDAVGEGSFTGGRQEALGGAVSIDVELTIDQSRD